MQPEVANCTSTGLYQCICAAPGVQLCSVIQDPPQAHDICTSDDYTPPTSQCSLTQTHCYTIWEYGHCADGKGPWSWCCFSTTCGCDLAGASLELKGSKNVCTAGSDGC